MRGMQDRDGHTVKAAIQNDIRDGHRRLSSMISRDGASDSGSDVASNIKMT
jgi:hypothetical protein